MGQRQREHCDHEDQYDQPRHNKARKFFNAFLDATIDDPCGQRKENEHKDDRSRLGCDKCGKISVLRERTSIRYDIRYKIFCNPSADDGIIRHNQGRYEKRQIAKKAPALFERPKRLQCILLRLPPDRYIRSQKHKAEGEHEYKIYEQEKPAAVLRT